MLRGPLPAAVWDGTDGRRHRRGIPLNNIPRLCRLPQFQTQSGGPEDVLGVPGTTSEPSRVELLAAIQGSRVALEGKIEMVAVEVNLLRADLRKVSEKVKEVTSQHSLVPLVLPEKIEQMEP
ncbi:hypothetical protein NDU88_003272 [Pleurodeles waltl]|uniref:Uncharacterized protein n=1 Tax=Pleurodeles waltl TaxID=8319 RepID=A0AAV7T4U1_PLEWA|nr:hypothetical protein NDU88_003272 [Pleurodeles waltl]